jgi:hypothetical protein
LNLAPGFRALHARRIDPDTTCDWLCAQITPLAIKMSPKTPTTSQYLPLG